MNQGALQITGLRELNRAFARAPKTLNREWREAQRFIGEPVRRVAAARAVTEVERMPRSPQWARMRTGITQRAVYVAPAMRGTRMDRRKRPNLADLLMERALAPALVLGEAEIVRRAEHVLETVGRDWEK